MYGFYQFSLFSVASGQPTELTATTAWSTTHARITTHSADLYHPIFISPCFLFHLVLAFCVFSCRVLFVSLLVRRSFQHVPTCSLWKLACVQRSRSLLGTRGYRHFLPTEKNKFFFFLVARQLHLGKKKVGEATAMAQHPTVWWLYQTQHFYTRQHHVHACLRWDTDEHPGRITKHDVHATLGDDGHARSISIAQI